MKNLHLREQTRETREEFLDNGNDTGDSKCVRKQVTIHEECTLEEMKSEVGTEAVRGLPAYEIVRNQIFCKILVCLELCGIIRTARIDGL